jgi:hypothetical protein
MPIRIVPFLIPMEYIKFGIGAYTLVEHEAYPLPYTLG